MNPNTHTRSRKVACVHRRPAGFLEVNLLDKAVPLLIGADVLTGHGAPTNCAEGRVCFAKLDNKTYPLCRLISRHLATQLLTNAYTSTIQNKGAAPPHPSRRSDPTVREGDKMQVNSQFTTAATGSTRHDDIAISSRHDSTSAARTRDDINSHAPLSSSQQDDVPPPLKNGIKQMCLSGELGEITGHFEFDQRTHERGEIPLA